MHIYVVIADCEESYSRHHEVLIGVSQTKTLAAKQAEAVLSRSGARYPQARILKVECDVAGDVRFVDGEPVPWPIIAELRCKAVWDGNNVSGYEIERTGDPECSTAAQ